MAERRQDGRVQIAGVETCGSVSGCLRCAAIIRAARAEEIDYWAKAHLAAGGDLVFVTYTLPHVASDELAVLLDGMRAAWVAMNSGQGSMRVRERFAIRGFIRSYEFTYGTNGWHPHLHVLYFVDGNAELHNEDSEPLAEMRSMLGARWGHQISTKLERDIHGVYGVDARTVRDMAGIGDYVSKIHFETVRSDLKVKEQDRQRGGSRTPWQVGLDGVRDGERTDIARWREYVEATKGLRVHEPSRSIRAMYGKPETTGADMTDEQLAAETPEQGIPEVGIANDLWGTARRARRNGQSVVAQALLALEDHGLEAMRSSL